MAWSVNLLNELRRNKFIGEHIKFVQWLRFIHEADLQIADDKGHEKLLNEIKQVESANYKLKCLVWVNFPMAYTQASLNRRSSPIS